MKIGFTGTRHGLVAEQFLSLDWLLYEATRPRAGGQTVVVHEFHHGDCLGGDAAAAAAARMRDFFVIAHPPVDFRLRAVTPSHEFREAKPYLERNHDIVDETDLLIACPAEYEEQLRSGTWATFRYARRIGRPVVMIWPDGTTTDSRAGAA